jgi:hypothetical protein
MSYSKTRTTYRPSTHPRWAKGSNAAVQSIQIHIHVMPAPTLAELTAMRDQIVCHTEDQTVWKHALNAEVMRCTPRMKREVAHPTQHACIDSAQVEQLSGILKPETLRRTFISMPALIAQIQADIAGP